MNSTKFDAIDLFTRKSEEYMRDALQWSKCPCIRAQAHIPDRQMTGAINEAIDAIRTVRELVRIRAEKGGDHAST